MRRLAVVAACAAMFIGPPARGQQITGPAVTMSVSRFTPWNDPATPLVLGVDVRNRSAIPISEAAVRITIYHKVLTRSSLKNALNGHPDQDALVLFSEPLPADLQPGASTHVEVERELPKLDGTFRKGRSRAAGVYPVQIEFAGSQGALATQWTALAYFSTPPEKRINVAWQLPLEHPPLIRPDGSYDGSAVDALYGSNGSLSRLAATLAEHSSLSLTLAPAGVLLDEAADIADGYVRRTGSHRAKVEATDDSAKAAAETLSALKSAVSPGAFELALTPYANADIVSLVHGDLLGDAIQQLAVGRAQVAGRLGRDPADGLYAPAGLQLDARSAATLAGLGVRTAIIDPSLVPPQPSIFGPDRPITAVGTDGVRLTALLADAPIRERLESPTPPLQDPVILAQDTLAETASAWFEQPANAATRSIVIATATTPPVALVGALAEGLSAAPWVQMQLASHLASVVTPREDPQPLVLGTDRAHDQTAAARGARRAVELLRDVIVSPAEAIDPLNRRVLVSETADWTATPARAIDIARAARLGADHVLKQIRPAPEIKVTLTSRTGNLPVTILNGTQLSGGHLKVKVRVVLSSAKVRFPRNDSETIEIEGTTKTISFPARALATGAFAVDVQIRTPDTDVIVGKDQIIVRSTAVSAVALAATGGGALFLLFAWTRRNMRRRAAAPKAAPK